MITVFVALIACQAIESTTVGLAQASDWECVPRDRQTFKSTGKLTDGLPKGSHEVSNTGCELETHRYCGVENTWGEGKWGAWSTDYCSYYRSWTQDASCCKASGEKYPCVISCSSKVTSKIFESLGSVRIVNNMEDPPNCSFTGC